MLKDFTIKPTSFLLLPPILFFMVLLAAYAETPYQQFSDQAWSFLHRRLDIPPQPLDTAVVNGKFYWTEGPFPSVILMPFQLLLGPNFRQHMMQALLIIVIAVLLYRLARLKKFSQESSIFLTVAFSLGSSAVWPLMVPAVWFYGQVVTIALLLGVLYERETRQRFWLLGLLLAGLWATRPPAGFIIFPIIFFAFIKYRQLKLTPLKLVGFFTPLVATASLLLWFNYARFGNIFDNGYWMNNIGLPLRPLRLFGLFSLSHIPMNIYWYFLSSYEAVTDGTAHIIFPYIKYSPWGLSFFLVAPFFLYAVTSIRERNAKTRTLWLTIAATLLLDITYSNTGYYQFGARYTVDFLPILYLLLLESLNPPDLTQIQKGIIIVSSWLNMYLLMGPLYFPS